jgi:hypothetical protein
MFCRRSPAAISPHLQNSFAQGTGAAFDLISDALPFGRLWSLAVSNAIDYAKFRSRSHDAVIRVYNAAGNLIETHEHADEFREVVNFYSHPARVLFRSLANMPHGWENIYDVGAFYVPVRSMRRAHHGAFRHLAAHDGSWSRGQGSYLLLLRMPDIV